MKHSKISVVIPSWNEEGNIGPMHEALTRTFSQLPNAYEIIFVNDGSSDGTEHVINAVARADKHVIPVHFQRNFQKAAAYMAGFKHATGDVIITMDADLQDDPSEIPRFLEALKQYDLVVGWKYNRKDPSITKKIPSKIFNALNRWLFGLALHDSDCGFRAMKSRVAKGLHLYGDVFRYIPALVKRQGFSVGEIKVQHHERRWGKSKYGFKRLLTGPFDLLTIKFMTEYNQRPLHLFGLGGLFFFSIGFVVGLYLLYIKYVRGDLLTPRTPLLLFSILLIVLGIQLVGIGLIGELIASQQKEERFIIKK